jgi:hypothetical protein
MPWQLFAPALACMNLGEWDVFGPFSFKRYLEEQGFSANTDTAAAISIDFHERLPPALPNDGVMALRLRVAPGGRKIAKYMKVIDSHGKRQKEPESFWYPLCK